MVRRISHVIAVLSLALLVTTLVLWHSQRRFYSGFENEFGLINDSPGGSQPEEGRNAYVMEKYDWNLAGFKLSRNDFTHSDHHGNYLVDSSTIRFAIPYWFVTVLTSTMLATWGPSRLKKFLMKVHHDKRAAEVSSRTGISCPPD
jgi:hypothetical protein